MHADDRENQSAGAGRGLLGLGDRGVDLAHPAGEVSGRLRLDVGGTIHVGLAGKRRIRVALVLPRGLLDQLDVALEHHIHLPRGEDQLVERRVGPIAVVGDLRVGGGGHGPVERGGLARHLGGPRGRVVVVGQEHTPPLPSRSVRAARRR